MAPWAVTARAQPGSGSAPRAAPAGPRQPRPHTGSGRGAASAAAASKRRDGGGAAFREVSAWGRPAAAAGSAAAGGCGGRWAAFQMAAPSVYGECGEGGRGAALGALCPAAAEPAGCGGGRSERVRGGGERLLLLGSST